MTFNSVQFAAFFVVFIACYRTIPRRFQNHLLLVGSYVFYGSWDYRFLGLIVLSTLVDYSLAREIYLTDDERRRKRLVTASVVVNLCILGFFKYANFFLDSFYDAAGAIGLGQRSVFIDIALPVGISFYTFQTMSYTIDVYRRKVSPASSLLTFAVYVAYFPQLVAGPIERAHALLPRIESLDRKIPRGDALVDAFFLIALGLVKKIVLADGVARIPNAIFADTSEPGGAMLLLGMVAFAVQIYGDFSGYTDIARGVSQLLGIPLVVNFTQPYLSRSATEHWRRWHISLGNWMRDYLYVPLGGNRKGARRTSINLFLTLALAGVWHGAGGGFVLFGVLNGLFVVSERKLGFVDPREPLKFQQVPRIFLSFLMFAVSLTFFRAGTLSQSGSFVQGLVGWRSGPFSVVDAVWVGCGLLVILVMDLGQRRADAGKADSQRRSLFIGSAVPLIALFSGGVTEPFVYFQF